MPRTPRRLLLPALLGLCAALAAPAGAAAPFADLPLTPRERRAVADCGADALCAARRLVRLAPEDFRIERLPRPDTDRIRWVVSTPSLGRVRRLVDGRLLVELRRFGRTLWHELRRLPAGARVVLDLRENGGGDLRRMLRLAARLVGGDAARIVLLRRDGVRRELEAAPAPVPPLRIDAVLVGAKTASSAEILAALLRRAGVPLCGARTYGKDRIEAALPLSGDRHLRASLGRALVPGVDLAGGLLPELPLRACLPAPARPPSSSGGAPRTG